jgi:hypothetical protein
MTNTTTPAEERAVDAIEPDDQHAVFRADVTREELVHLVRCVLDAAMNIDRLTDQFITDFARPDPEAPSVLGEAADRAIAEMIRADVTRLRTAVLGTNA